MNCNLCELSSRCNTPCLPVKGNLQECQMLIVGEAPGYDEDNAGVVFVGRSGQFLESALRSLEISLNDVAFTNAVKCAPYLPSPEGQLVLSTPEVKHIQACRNYLLHEIAIANPDVIVTLGDMATYAVLGKQGILRLRGKLYEFEITVNLDENTLQKRTHTVVPMYHPAHILRSQAKRVIWGNDLAKAKNVAWPNDGDYKLLKTPQEVIEYLDLLQLLMPEIGYVSLDVESDERNPYDPNMPLICISLSHVEKQGYVIPLFHPQNSMARDEIDIVVNALRESLPKLHVTWHGGKFDHQWLNAKLGINITNVFFDTLMAHRFLYTGTRPSDLDSLCVGYFGIHYSAEMKEQMGSGKSSRLMSQIDLNTITKYAGADADFTRRITSILRKELEDKKMLQPFQMLCMGTFQWNCQMERNGMYVLKSELEPLRESLEQEIDLLNAKLTNNPYGFALAEHQLKTGKTKAQRVVNWNSRDQQRYVLFHLMQLPVVKETDSKKPSTDKHALKELHEKCMLGQRPVEARMIELLQQLNLSRTIYSNFVKNMPKHLKPADEDYSKHWWNQYASFPARYTIHPNFNLAGTETGRASASDPPLHGTPKRSMVKRIFESRWHDTGGMIIEADLKQMEIRVLAMLCGDLNLRQVLSDGMDIHRYVASVAYGVPQEQVDDKLRGLAKSIIFGLIYGRSAESIAAQTGTTEAEAEKMMQDIFSKFPAIKQLMDSNSLFVENNGYISSPFGRQRIITPRRYNFNERKRRAMNTPIQSAASDLTMLLGNQTWVEMLKQNLQSLQIAFIHDAIFFDVYPGELFKLLNLIYTTFNMWADKVFDWVTIPLAADIEVGRSWYELLFMDIVDNSWVVKVEEKQGDKFEAYQKQLRLAFPQIELHHHSREDISETEHFDLWRIVG